MKIIKKFNELFNNTLKKNEKNEIDIKKNQFKKEYPNGIEVGLDISNEPRKYKRARL